MKNYVQPGETLALTAPYAVAAGEGLLVGSIFGVAKAAAASGAAVDALTQGVVDLKKGTAAGTAIAAGAKVYWDNAAKVATGTATANTLIGAAVASAADADATVRVKLTGQIS